jgi:hypothetical protein
MNFKINTRTRNEVFFKGYFIFSTNFCNINGSSIEFDHRNDPFSILMIFPSESNEVLFTAFSSISSLFKNFCIRLLDTLAYEHIDNQTLNL